MISDRFYINSRPHGEEEEGGGEGIIDIISADGEVEVTSTSYIAIPSEGRRKKIGNDIKRRLIEILPSCGPKGGGGGFPLPLTLPPPPPPRTLIIGKI